MTLSYGPYAFGSPFITWAGLFMIAGILAGGTLFACAMPRQGASRRTALRLVLVSVLCGIAGARLFHVVDYWDFFSGAPFHVVYLWEGGYSLWGGVLGGLAAGLWKAGRDGLERASIADAAALPGLLGLAIGRVGGFLGGDPPATESSLPWAVVYDHPDSFAYAGGAAVHPVALYELLWDAVAALVVLRCRKRLPEGAVMPLALAVWGAGRAAISLVRLDPTMLGLQQAQWVGLLVLVAVALWAGRSRLRGRPRARGGGGGTARSP